MKPPVRTSYLQDVCVFCATRIQLASSKAIPRTHRRFLQSSNATFKPPAVAAAAQTETPSIITYEDVPRQTASFGRGFRKVSPKVTPEEAALRQGKELHPPPSGTRNYRLANGGFKYSRPSKWPTSPSIRLQAANSPELPIRSPKGRPDHDDVLWRCTSCGWSNHQQESRCQECNSFHVKEAQLGRGSGRREPLMRYGHGSEPRGGEGSSGNNRYQRTEQSRGQRFANARPLQMQQDIGLPPRETQTGRVRDQTLPMDRPTMKEGLNLGPRPRNATQSQRPPAYSQPHRDLDKTFDINRRPSYSEDSRDNINPKSTIAPVSPAPSQRFGSGWNTYQSETIALSDAEKSQRPAQSSINKSSSTTAQARATQNDRDMAKFSDGVSWFKPSSADASLTSLRESQGPVSKATLTSHDGRFGEDTSSPRRAYRNSRSSPEAGSSAISELQNAGHRDISWLEATSTSSPRAADRNVSWRSNLRGEDIRPLPSFTSPKDTQSNQRGWSPQSLEKSAQYNPTNSVPLNADLEGPRETSRKPQTIPGIRQAVQSTSARPEYRKRSGRYSSKLSTPEPRDKDAYGAFAGRKGSVAAPYAYGVRRRQQREEQDDYEEEDEEQAQEARRRRKQQRKRERAAEKLTGPPTPIYLPEFISVGNLARVLHVRVEDFARKMQDLGFEETNNDYLIDAEIAGLIAAEFNFEPIVDSSSEDQDLHARPPAEDKAVLPARPPVVTIMGHVDHGKTTLLDYLRKSSVAASEHGGITQHIGAFSVFMPGGRLITFLDTPGHAAFLSMRQRGANVTDIVILVVAADDSVKPQTIEAIKHAQAAKVPMIVAINKVDKEDKNIDRVKQDLARYGVEIEDFGGETQVVCVSGKTGQGLDELEENVVALADILDMRAETDGQAEGWVLEGATKRAGRVATVLVRRGTVRPGDIIVAGSTWAKVRTLKNEAGVQIPHAGPGTPVEVDGWKDQPTAGDEVLQATSEQQAKSAVETRIAKAEKEQMAADISVFNESRRLEQERKEALAKASAPPPATATDEISTTQTTEVPQKPVPTTAPTQSTAAIMLTLPLLLKADVSGSVEACVNTITSLGTSIISPVILRSSVGLISESDITFAASSGALILSFNQTTSPEMYRLAEREGVKLMEENIIYRLADLIKRKLEELLPEKVETRVIGEAEIAKPFEIGIGGRKKMLVAGCRVRNGVVSRANKVKVLRGGEGGACVYDGTLSSLKNVKKDVTEMRKGTECGMAFEGWEDFKEGDMVQCYEEKKFSKVVIAINLNHATPGFTLPYAVMSMDPLSVIAGVLGIVSVAAKSSKSLYELIDAVRSAPNEIKNISRDTQAFYSIIFSLESSLKDSKVAAAIADDEALTALVGNLREPLVNCASMLGQLMVKIQGFIRPLDGERWRFSSNDLRWWYGKREVVELTGRVEAMKATLNTGLTAVGTLCNIRLVAVRIPAARKPIRRGSGDTDAGFILRRYVEERETASQYTSSLAPPSPPAEAFRQARVSTDTTLQVTESGSGQQVIDKVERLHRAENQRNALLQAAQQGDTLLTEVALEEGADVNAKGPEGTAAIHIAVFRGHYEVVEILIKHGADINLLTNRDSNPGDFKFLGGRTALHWAAIRGYEDIVRLLIKNKANIDATSSRLKQTPLQDAIKDVSTTSIANLLLEHGASVISHDDEGWTTLHQAAHSGHVAMIDILIDKGCDIEAHTFDNSTVDSNRFRRTTPLFLAAANGKEAAVKALMAHGANHRCHNIIEEMPIHVACWRGFPSIVRIMLDSGMDIEEKDVQYEETPLLKAASTGQIGVLKLLIERGANLDAETQWGRNALQHAQLHRKTGNEEAVHYLKGVYERRAKENEMRRTEKELEKELERMDNEARKEENRERRKAGNKAAFQYFQAKRAQVKEQEHAEEETQSPKLPKLKVMTDAEKQESTRITEEIREDITKANSLSHLRVLDPRSTPFTQPELRKRAGSAGASAAYYLQKLKGPCRRINITIYERNDFVGGRSTTVNAYDDPNQPVELGASIFVKVNHNLVNAAETFGLPIKDMRVSRAQDRPEVLGVWDGEQFVFTQSDASNSYWNIAKLLWKYGYSPIRTQNLMKKTVGSFLKMYHPPYFPFASLSQTASDLDLLHVTATTGHQYLEANSISDHFAHDIIQASTRVNYAQNLDQIHGLETMVCMATDGAMSIEGGNWQIFNSMIKASGATLLLNTAVESITKNQRSGQYTLKTTSPSLHPAQDILSSSENSISYDTIILATPLQFANLTFEAPLSNNPPKTPYVSLHVTLFTSPYRLSPAFFSLPDSAADEMPTTILTTTPPPASENHTSNQLPFFSISTLRTLNPPREYPRFLYNTDEDDEARKEYLYKTFSPAEIGDEFIHDLLDTPFPSTHKQEVVSWIYRK
ncbi:MAG: hypothetical protein Q9170_006602, partial [Blastenia crenularia]